MKSKNSIRTLLAFLFLASYVNVFALNLACNYSRIFSSGHSHDNHNHDHHSHKDHGHGSHDKHHKGEDKQKDKDDGNCCNDEAGKVFESVFVTLNNELALDVLSVSVLPANISFLPTDYKITYHSVSNYSLPPPKVPDIRIHIQSFQI